MAFTWSLAVIMTIFVCAVLSGWAVALVALNPEDGTRLPRNLRRIVARSAILTGAGVVAFVGLGTLLGAPAAVLLVATTAGLSPYVATRCVHWLREHGHLSEPAARPPLPDSAQHPREPSPLRITPVDAEWRLEPEELASLSNEALCLAWRASYSALRRTESPAQRLRVVEERRAYLDEIERRNALGMAAWLASGPRAAGDPSRFVLGDSATSSARIDWNDLLHDTDQ
ncbi:hypothetical protein AB0L64_09325 [Kribbella sp. NPDC051936]|uniref:hypothetical protein n=1 Tax=Kribbella sp. NPDC051936 TaxID=3154946 RepID=UPI003433EB0D